MKQLTQDVFKGAPDWVRSASVDCEGDLFFHGCKADDLIVSPTKQHEQDFECQRKIRSVLRLSMSR